MRMVVGRTLGALALRGLARKVEDVLVPKRFAPEDPFTPGGVERALMAARAAGLTKHGDYYEFGLFRGYTFWHAQHVMTIAGEREMRFVGFDSFAGLPEPDGIDRYKADFVKGQYCASLSAVRTALDEHGVDWDRTVLVPGFFEDTLAPDTVVRHALRPAAVVLIDSDLYRSAVVVLEFLDGLLMDGAYVLFDDWNAFDADETRGERRAFREFLDRHPQWSAAPAFEFGTYGAAFRLVHPGRATERSAD
jgi:O-methyltransferase